ncbi:phage tail tip lysozyme, partial [Candidatus Saccharibacteria bacterium]|nr:phage tail tip lysozyme [Candidatus Saccharibacteria bacterium]
LQQEHRFRTADVPGGLGIAQWMGGRRAGLLGMENPFWISTQLEFVMIELNGAYWRVRDALLAVETVEDATRIFQNQYEKCGICKEEQRIVFAWELYHKYVQE